MPVHYILRFALLNIALASFLPATAAWARLAPYNGIGGDGGAPFRVDCGEYGVLVGLVGRSGDVIDQVGGLCVKIDPISGTWIGVVYETSRHGGNGGGPFRKVCPVGQAVNGIEGNVKYFSGVTVAGSLEIRCIELGIHKAWNGPQIMGTRFLSLNGDPDPLKIQASQDYCAEPRKGTGHYERLWERIGIALEGRAGQLLDRVHIVCGSFAQDKQGYRVEFRTSHKTAIPEGTPLQISWRASGVKPELTPNLKYSWELSDLTHTRTASGPFGGFPVPTRIANPCAYAAQPCNTSASSVTFTALPPATYELRLKVTPAVSPAHTEASIGSEATTSFEITPNRLVSVSLSPSTIRTGGASTATIKLQGPAPPRGMTVYLSSSDPQIVSTPNFITVPGGQSSSSLTLRADSKAVGAQVTVTASLRKPIAMEVVPQGTLQQRSEAIGQTARESVNPQGVVAQPVPQAVSRPFITRSAESGIAAPTPAEGDKPVTEAPEAVNPPVVTRGLDSAAVVKPDRAVTELLTGPSDSKRAVLTIQANLATQPFHVPDKKLPFRR